VTRVFLIEDHASFRQALAFMMDREADLEVVAQAGSLTEALRLVDTPMDVAVVDLQLPDGAGASFIPEMRRRWPEAVAIVLSGSDARADRAKAVEMGAMGVMHKSAEISEIIDGVRRVARGEPLMTPREANDLIQWANERREEERDVQAVLESLTPRERDVLRGLGKGLGDKDIAAEIGVSSETVRTHMVNLLGKIGVQSRLQALVFAVRHGAITIE
jgi:RNA polymerase sigma factor (sigma-70 family)